MRSSTSKPDMSGRRRSRPRSRTAARAGSAPRRRCRHDDLDVVVAEQFADAQLFGGVVLDDQQAFAARLRVILDPRKAASSLRASSVGDERESAACEAVLPILVEGDDLHRDMTGKRVLLELAEHIPAQHVRQEHIERYRGRLILPGRASSASSPRMASSTLKPLSRARSSRIRRSADRPRRSAEWIAGLDLDGRRGSVRSVRSGDRRAAPANRRLASQPT